MSYEGYYQKICSDGHYYTSNDVFSEMYSDEPVKTICPVCGSEEAWSNSVDETNCDAVGFIDMSEFVISPSEFSRSTLPDGRIQTVTIEAQYRIPTKEETYHARTWYDCEGNRVFLNPKEAS